MKNVFPFFKLLLFCLFSAYFLSAQQKNNFVAKIGDVEITVDEYKLRYELMPLVSFNRNPDSLKNEFLYTLIAEKLFAREAENLGYAEQQRFKDLYGPLEKIFVRDALFKAEVESKVKISSVELQKGISRFPYTLYANIISSKNENEINTIFSQLQSGASFDSLLQLREEYAFQKEPLEIKYGQMEEEFVEDTLFNLAVGNFTTPVKTNSGWFIFKLKNKIYSSNESDLNKISSSVKKILKEQKTRKLGMEYFKNFLSDFTTTPDEQLFWQLVQAIVKTLSPKDTVINKAEKDFIYLSPTDIDRVKQELGKETIHKSFVLLKTKNASINDFLNYYLVYDFRIKSISEDEVAMRLSNGLKSFIENELLAQEGFRRGLDKLPQVKNELKIWKDNYLFQLYRNSLMNELIISESEIIDMYNKMYKTGEQVSQVNIIEIRTDDLIVAEEILNQLKEGEDFKTLAQEYSGDENVESGFVAVSQLGEIGKITLEMNIGDIYGPLKISGSYSIFKLIAKKEAELSAAGSYDEVKENIKMQLMNERLSENLKIKAIQLAGKNGLTINEKVIASLKLTNVNMIAYRRMGFGGRIAGVPYLSPFHEWIKETKTLKKILP